MSKQSDDNMRIGAREKSAARKDADRAHQMIMAAKTSSYWIKRIRVLQQTGKGAWQHNPEFIQEIISLNGNKPK